MIKTMDFRSLVIGLASKTPLNYYTPKKNSIFTEL